MCKVKAKSVYILIWILLKLLTKTVLDLQGTNLIEESSKLVDNTKV